jgi:hypothetical protein
MNINSTSVPKNFGSANPNNILFASQCVSQGLPHSVVYWVSDIFGDCGKFCAIGILVIFFGGLIFFSGLGYGVGRGLYSTYVFFKKNVHQKFYTKNDS